MSTRELRRSVPGVYEGFAKLHDAAFADGTLDRKTKELLALGIAIAKGCHGCIAVHARELARLGANHDEIAEVIGVTVVMGGGPAATAYGPEAFVAFNEFAGERVLNPAEAQRAQPDS